MNNPVVLVLVVVLIVLLLGSVPAFGFHSYGYWPSGGIGLLLIVVLLLLLLR